MESCSLIQLAGCSLVLDLFIDCVGSSFLCADRNEVFFFFLVADKPRLRLVARHRLLIALASLVAECGLHAHRLQ